MSIDAPPRRLCDQPHASGRRPRAPGRRPDTAGRRLAATGIWAAWPSWFEISDMPLKSTWWGYGQDVFKQFWKIHCEEKYSSFFLRPLLIFLNRFVSKVICLPDSTGPVFDTPLSPQKLRLASAAAASGMNLYFCLMHTLPKTETRNSKPKARNL